MTTTQTLAEWQPNVRSQAFEDGVAAAGVDVAAEMVKFRKFPFREALRDPDKAYVAWLRKAAAHQSTRKPASEQVQARPTDTERMLAQVHAFRESNPAEYRRLELYMEQHRWWEKADRGFQVAQMLSAIHDREIIFTYLDEQGREF